MIRVLQTEGSVVEMEATGEITHEDYKVIIPELNRVIASSGMIDCLLHLHHLKSVEFKAVMEDLKFDAKHATDFRRIAVVTDKKWHEWATKLWGVFLPNAEVKCFEPEEMARARDWVRAAATASA